jgi:hypothetical protein
MTENKAKKESCETCRFFIAGCCCRRAPQGQGADAGWPATTERSWCGEWRRRGSCESDAEVIATAIRLMTSELCGNGYDDHGAIGRLSDAVGAIPSTDDAIDQVAGNVAQLVKLAVERRDKSKPRPPQRPQGPDH